MDTVNAIVVVIFVILLYFLPSLIGGKKRNIAAIFALNLLAGWTVVGWIVAFVWAFTTEPPSPAIEQPSVLCSACGKYSVHGMQFCGSCGAQIA